MTKTQEKQAEQEDALTRLREMFPPGSTVTTVLNHVSRSGMSRAIAVVVCAEGQPEDVSWLVARSGETFDRNHGGIKMQGAGMDMGFALAYNLSSALYPDGFECTGEGDGSWHSYCPSNDHSNGDRDYTPHHHTSGGYALRHRWL